jgi:hypothetical protein
MSAATSASIPNRSDVETPKCYLLFAGDNGHDRMGGWRDYKGSYYSAEEPAWLGREHQAAVDPAVYWGWWHVVDLNSGSIVASSE